MCSLPMQYSKLHLHNNALTISERPTGDNTHLITNLTRQLLSIAGEGEILDQLGLEVLLGQVGIQRIPSIEALRAVLCC